MSAALPFPSSRCRPPQGGHRFASLHTCHGLVTTPVEPWTLALTRLLVLDCFAPPHRAHPCGAALRSWLSRSARFSITLVNLLPHVSLTGLYQPSGVCETPCGLRDFVPSGPAVSLRIQDARCAWQSVYASIMLFSHPFFRIPVGNAVPPARFNGLANITATLGSFYWLGFETSGLSPDKKRLAWLGAQRQRPGAPDRERASDCGLRVMLPVIIELKAGQGLSVLACCASCYLLRSP